MRKTALDMVYELAKEDRRIFFIGSDLGYGTLNKFKEEMSDRFFMEGVCEANVIGMAGGLALSGKIVYVNTIATFLTRRCFEQVAIDLCLHDVKVRLIGNGGGLVYAPLGPTHLATEDIAIFRALPNMTILAPADAQEMRYLVPKTVDIEGPVYIRLGKGGDPIVSNYTVPFEIGRVFTMAEGNDALILTTGITLKLGLAAAAALKGHGIGAAVIHAPTIKPLDGDAIIEKAAKVRAVVTVEEHTIVGGFGSAVAELILEAGFPNAIKFKRIGIPDTFPDKYGSQESLMGRYDITSDNIVSTVRSLLKD